jgi:hypothetical protein
MTAAGQAPQHRRGIVVVARLPEDLSVDDDRGVGTKDEGAGPYDQHRRGRFLRGEPAHVRLCRFAGAHALVHSGDNDLECKSSGSEQLSTPWGSGRKDKAHVRIWNYE